MLAVGIGHSLKKNIEKQNNFAKEFNNSVSQFIDTTASKRNEWLDKFIVH